MRTSLTDYAQALFELLENQGKEENKEKIITEFVNLLKRKKLLSKSKRILAKLEKIYNQKKGIVPVTLLSAYPLNEEEKRRVKEIINQELPGQKVELKEKIDKNLKGGFKLVFGEKVIDDTTHYRLQRLREALRS